MGFAPIDLRIDSDVHLPIVPHIPHVVKYGMFTMTALASTDALASDLTPCNGNPTFPKRGGTGREAGMSRFLGVNPADLGKSVRSAMTALASM
jgi:hypothetical protein